METFKEKFHRALTSFGELVIKAAKKSFLREGEHAPLVTAMISNPSSGKFDIVVLAGLGDLFGTDEGKATAAMIIEKMSDQVKPLALAFITEAWTLSIEASDKDKVLSEDGSYQSESVRPHNHPNRVEALVIVMETFDKECISSFQIEREGDRISLKKHYESNWLLKKDEKVSGLFTNLLSKNYSETASLAGEAAKSGN